MTRDSAERELRGWFRNWLADLDDDQIVALEDNWENVMSDAALDRVDSWVIADRAIAKLREPGGPAAAVMTGGVTRVFLPGDSVAHLREDVVPAENILCRRYDKDGNPLPPGSYDSGFWLGTGSQEEYDAAQALPLCGNCVTRMSAGHRR